MSTYVPNAVQVGLNAARMVAMESASKLRLRTAEGECPVLRLWGNGFSVACQDAPKLRGFVDLYEGSRHLFQCLIVASGEDGVESCYDFKRITAVTAQPPRDFVVSSERPVALISYDQP